jgi:hypothetical protein
VFGTCTIPFPTQEKGLALDEIGIFAIPILADGLQIQAEPDSNINAREFEAPLVMPAELVKMRTGIFIKEAVDQYRVHLGKHWCHDRIDKVESDHRDLRVAYAREPNVKAAFDKHGEDFFNEAWDIVKGRFNDLRQFCGGLAIAFPNTTSVESDFSFVKWEKNDTRTSLTRLALAGIMQAKQFDLSRTFPTALTTLFLTV